jgi:hypothetical protein
MEIMKALFDRNLYFNMHLTNKTGMQPFTFESDYVRLSAVPLWLLKIRAHLGTSSYIGNLTEEESYVFMEVSSTAVLGTIVYRLTTLYQFLPDYEFNDPL